MYIYFVSKFVLNAMLFRIYIVHIVEMFLFLTWLNLYNLHKRYYWYSFNRFIWKWYYFLLKVCQKIMRNLAVIVDCIWGDFEIQSWRIRRISRFSELRISNFFSEIFRTFEILKQIELKTQVKHDCFRVSLFFFSFFLLLLLNGCLFQNGEMNLTTTINWKRKLLLISWSCHSLKHLWIYPYWWRGDEIFQKWL